jgi:hypothetical protein
MCMYSIIYNHNTVDFVHRVDVRVDLTKKDNNGRSRSLGNLLRLVLLLLILELLEWFVLPLAFPTSSMSSLRNILNPEDGRRLTIK